MFRIKFFLFLLLFSCVQWNSRLVSLATSSCLRSIENDQREFFLSEESNQNLKKQRCTICNEDFLKIFDLKKHKQIHFECSKYKCLYIGCNALLKTQEMLENHLIEHVQNGAFPLFKCSSCQILFVTARRLQKHSKIHTDYRPYKCQYCDSSFHDKFNKNDHERRHSMSNQHRCSICTKIFLQNSKLKKHLKTHTEDITNETSMVRNQEPSTSSNLEILPQNPSQETINKIPFVQFKTDIPDRNRMRKGENEETDQNLKKERCTICNESFLEKYHLTTHRKIHYKGKYIYCLYDGCYSLFKKQIMLENHLIEHVQNGDPYLFECYYCSIPFETAKRLQNHSNRHTAPCSYKCQYCDSAFYQRSNKEQHEKRHNISNQHRCFICTKLFLVNSKLTEHLKTHTEDISNETFMLKYEEEFTELRKIFFADITATSD